MSDPKPVSAATKSKTFKPRAGIVRKSKAERDAHTKQEAEKAAARAASAAQAAVKPAQPNKPGSSKKREQGRDNRDGSQGTSGGVFGSTTATRPVSKRAVIDIGQSEMLEGQEGVVPTEVPSSQGKGSSSGKIKASGKGSSAKGGATADGGTEPKEEQVDLPSESDNEFRRDIETIWISSDEDGGKPIKSTGKGTFGASNRSGKKRQKNGLRPMRVPIFESDDESDSETDSKGDLRSERHGHQTGEEDTGMEGDEMEVDEDTELPSSRAQEKRDGASSPELSKKVKPSRKVRGRARDGKLLLETIEEKAERRRLGRDIVKLQEEFVGVAPVKSEEQESIGTGSAKPEAKLFLFQFPPLVPFLSEQDSRSGAAEHQCNIRQSAHSIKTEDGQSQPLPNVEDNAQHSESSFPKPAVEGTLTAIEPLRLPSGRVGKMRVHESGKITLDWGGTDMEVRYGTEVNFLQDAVLVQSASPFPDDDEHEPKQEKGMVYALGRVEKKLIVIPDWQKLYD